MTEGWLVTKPTVLLAATCAVAIQASVLVYTVAPTARLLQGLYLVLAFLLPIAGGWSLGWRSRRRVSDHVSRWFEVALGGGFLGWLIGYVVAGAILAVMLPTYPLVAASLVEAAIRDFFYQGIAVGLAVICGIAFGRVDAEKGWGRQWVSIHGLAVGLLGGGAFAGTGIQYPRIPWEIDQFGVTSLLLEALLPFVILLVVGTVAWVFTSSDAADCTRSLIGGTAIGGLLGCWVVFFVWRRFVEAVPFLASELVLVGVFSVPAILAVLTGLVIRAHGFSSAERARFRGLLEDYTRDALAIEER